MSKRRKFSSSFKTKVVLEALREDQSLAELAQKHDLHPTQISSWKRDFLSKAESVFADSSTENKPSPSEDVDALQKKIGQLTIEVDFLKKLL